MTCDQTLGAALRTRVADHVTALRESESTARQGDDPEGVHLMRVAVRRIRSDLRLFRRALPEAERTDLAPELGWLGAVLGEVRDADVLLSVVTSRLDLIPNEDRDTAGLLLPPLEEARRMARTGLVAALNSSRYVALLASLDALATGTTSTSTGRKPARRVVPRLARRAWRRLHRAAVALGPRAEDPEQLHHLRILTKRARYAIEACDSVGVTATRKLARRLAALQDHLGELHDLVVAREWLRETTHHQCDPDVALAAGELAELMWREQCRLTETWHGTWDRANRTRPRPWSGR